MNRLNAKTIHLLITLGVMLLIFAHSAMSGELSGNESTVNDALTVGEQLIVDVEEI